MLLRRTRFFAVLVILLLVPVTSLTLSSAFSPPAQTEDSSTTPTINSNGMVSIPLALPPVISQSVSLGAANPSTPVSLGFVLPPKDETGLQQYIQDISSTSSKEYRDFLTTQQYAEQFGPSAEEASALLSFLSSKGLSASLDESNPDLVVASGTASAAEKALDVSIQSFELGGTSFYSATSDLQLPSEFSNIQNVFGLTDYSSNINVAATPMYEVLGAINSTQATTSNSVYYSPSEIAEIYNSSSLLNAGYTGQGVTIGIIDAFGDPYIQQELDNFSSEFNLPQTTVNVICVDGPCDYAEGIAQGWNTEIALDVEWSHAMAPKAAINLYIASNDTFPLYDAVQEAVNSGANSIISMSWGSPENSFGQSGAVVPVFGENYPWLDQVLQQAAAEGITAFAASGDWGAYDQAEGETSPYGGAIYPSTDPYVTAVGGTSLYMNATGGYLQFPYSNATGGYGSETAWSWSDYFGDATGGGYSTFFGTPQWQSGPGLSSGGRGVPDVAWDADPQTGVIVSIANPTGVGYTYYVIGGTSVGSPSWAGSLALLDQKAGGKLGFIDPTLYSILNNPTEYAKAFHDVTVGNNDPNSAGPGWNPLTGMGSPNLGELANYLAPTGSLGISVSTQLSGSLTASYSYGTSIQFTATVTSSSSTVTSGTVSASIVGPSGQQIATNIPFSYNAGTWIGSYTIKATDPPGVWTAEVSAKSGTSSGVGFTTFSVGDGVTLFLPYYNFTTQTSAAVFLLTGETINVSAAVTFPGGQCCVSGGSYTATFTLGGPSGKIEGQIPLIYNGSDQLWQGSFPIPYSADQGAWTLTVSGTDSNGNSGSAYSWLNVGLNVLLTTDSPDYVLGDTVTILAAPEYPDGSISALGTFNAAVTDGSKIIAEVPLTFNWVYGLWIGTLTLGTLDPVGFYEVTVSGNDGAGNYGSFGTVFRVAPYNLAGSVTLPSKEISISGGSEPTVTAKIAYPNGTLMKTGSVEAFVSLDMNGTFFPVSHSRLSYQASLQSFVGPNLLTSTSIMTTTPGEYLVQVLAYDSSGDYANLSSTFFVNANPHSAISITSDSQFTSANGVVSGSGTIYAPYIIAGWNTSSISISSGVTASYTLLNNWVEGSSGNGITINGGSALIENDYALSSNGDGLLVNNSSGAVISEVDASDNAVNGIVLSNGNGQAGGGLLNSVAVNNGNDGFVLQDDSYYTIATSSATSDQNYGFYVFNSENVTMAEDNATSDNVGIYLSGSTGKSYGGAVILEGNLIENNIGLEINGLYQNITGNLTNNSLVDVEGNIQLENYIGTLAANDSIVGLLANTIGYNDYGVIIQNSLPLAVDNVISENAEAGLNITGSYTGDGHCQVEFTNSTTVNYDACIAINYVTTNGAAGLAMSNLNGSFVYENAAVGNAADGFDFTGMTGSVISSLISLSNEYNGVTVSDSTNSRITANELGGNTNGLELKSSSNNTVDLNNATLNLQDGILLSDSQSDTVNNNVAIEDASGCNGLVCSVAGGIELSGSSGNVVYLNTLTNNTASSGGVGAGIYIDSGSQQNILFQNNATLNYAGIAIATSGANNIQKNSLYSNTYGIFLSNAPNNVIVGNSFGADQQDQYPDQPSVTFSNIQNGTSISGMANLSWGTSGQGISLETLLIDGTPQEVSGSSFELNSTALSDGTHTLTIQVTDTGGLTASSTVVITTSNHRGLYVQALGPGGTPLPGLTVNVIGGSGTLNATTGSDGAAFFRNLTVGAYVASTVVNGTKHSVALDFTGNSTVTLYVPELVTTALAPLATGGSIPIRLSGNITALEISNLFLDNSKGEHELSFTVNGINGTFAEVTMTIPKSAVPGGLVPKVMVNGEPAKVASYTENSGDYYVTFGANLGSGTSVSIQFLHIVSYNIGIAVVLGIVAAMLAGGLVLAFRGTRRSSYVSY